MWTGYTPQKKLGGADSNLGNHPVPKTRKQESRRGYKKQLIHMCFCLPFRIASETWSRCERAYVCIRIFSLDVSQLFYQMERLSTEREEQRQRNIPRSSARDWSPGRTYQMLCDTFISWRKPMDVKYFPWDVGPSMSIWMWLAFIRRCGFSSGMHDIFFFPYHLANLFDRLLR